MSLTSVGIYEFNAKDLIGHGAFAVVYKGRLKTVSVIISSFHHSLVPKLDLFMATMSTHLHLTNRSVIILSNTFY